MRRGSPCPGNKIINRKEARTTSFQAQGVFNQVADASREVVLAMQNNPALWSKTMFTKALQRLGGSVYNIQDVQSITNDYLSVLAQTIRKGDIS